MICHLKFIFTWILFLPQLTGNVFYGIVIEYCECLLSPLGSSYKELYFILTAADCCAF